MTKWFKIADEDGPAVAVVGNVRFGVPGDWTTPVPVSGTAATSAATYGRSHNATLLGQIQTDAADAKNRYRKIMLIGDSITAATGSTGWRTQLSALIAAQAAVFYPVDFVGNARYGYNDGSEGDLDSNAHGGYVANYLNATSGTGAGSGPTGSGVWQDARDADDWFDEQAPDFVIVHLGSNDANGSPVPANIMAAHSLLLAKARAANPAVIYYICKIVKNADSTANSNVTAINAVVDAWAATNWSAKQPVEVIDLNTGFNTGTMLQVDGLHPNATGAAFMAGKVFDVLDPWLLKPLRYRPPSGQPFDRITVTLQGAWTGMVPINLDNAIDFWIPSDNPVDGAMTNSLHRVGGGGRITVSPIGGMASTGLNQNAASSFVWTNGVGTENHPNGGNLLDTNPGTGPGWHIDITAPRWPDWEYARIFYASAVPVQIEHTFNMDDSEALEVIRSIGAGENSELGDSQLNSQYVDVRFASDKVGKTLSCDIARSGGSMGYWILCAIVLYRGPAGDTNGATALLTL